MLTMTDSQWLHLLPFVLQKKLPFPFHLCHTLVLSISIFHWFSKKHDGNLAQENVKIQKRVVENVKLENAYHYKMYLRIFYNMTNTCP